MTCDVGDVDDKQSDRGIEKKEEEKSSIHL